MKVPKGAVTGVIVIGIIVIAAYWATMNQRYRDRGAMAQRIISSGSDRIPETIEGLRSAIALYERRIEQHARDVARTGLYWKILAVRLQDQRLHGEALEALARAINYTPEDPALHYYTGISAGIMAKSQHIFPGRDISLRNQYFALAEDSFLRAIELDDRYLRPRYSLGVLYVFDLDRPEEAIVHLERCLEISRNDVDAMLVLARAHFMLTNFQAAVDIYDRIITITRDEQKRIDARNNREQALRQMYG